MLAIHERRAGSTVYVSVSSTYVQYLVYSVGSTVQGMLFGSTVHGMQCLKYNTRYAVLPVQCSTQYAVLAIQYTVRSDDGCTVRGVVCWLCNTVLVYTIGSQYVCSVGSPVDGM